MKIINGGVTAAKGFEAAAAKAQIKYKDRTDMALIYSETPCVAARIWRPVWLPARHGSRCPPRSVLT